MTPRLVSTDTAGGQGCRRFVVAVAVGGGRREFRAGDLWSALALVAAVRSSWPQIRVGLSRTGSVRSAELARVA